MKNTLFVTILMFAVLVFSCKKETTEPVNPEPPIPQSSNKWFSVTDSTKVYFSHGNLQYEALSDIWKFAENQWDTNVGDGWSNLLNWRNYDSVVDNYRNMTKDEWLYVLETRNTNSGTRYAKAQLNGINGMILLPDGWDNRIYELNEINIYTADYPSNVIDSTLWESTMEPQGAVFLPASGYRIGEDVYGMVDYGYYWTATGYNDSWAYYWRFGIHFYETNKCPRDYGLAVRLVCDAE